MFYLTKVQYYAEHTDKTEVNYGLVVATNFSAAANVVTRGYTDPSTNVCSIEALTMIPVGEDDTNFLELDEDDFKKLTSDWVGDVL